MKTRLWIPLMMACALGCGEENDDVVDDDAAVEDAAVEDAAVEADAAVDMAEPPPLICGDLTCEAGEYCYETSGGASPTVNHECRPLPDGCAACDCLPDEAVGFCTETDRL